MKKRGILLLLVTLTSLFLSACGNQTKGTYPDFLTEKDWIYENMICTQRMWFGAEGEFYYSEACGNPVGDSDLYETYSCNEETDIITLYGCDASVKDKQMEVLRYDEHSLMLKMEDGIIEFYYDESVPILDSSYSGYVEGYSAYSSIVEINGDTMTIGPSGYDADSYSKDVLREVKLAEDVTYFELYIETRVTDEKETRDDTYIEMSEADVEALLDGTLGIGFIWYNEDLEIEKILFYGELIIYE